MEENKEEARVLLIDDQMIVIEAVRKMVEDEPRIIFHGCQNPLMAIKEAEKFKPTVILQDLNMPQVDGLVLLRYFRANQKTKKIPMVVLSSEEEAKIKAEAFSLGANDYLVKLPDRRELLARIFYHSSAYIHLCERDDAFARLEKTQEHLQRELQFAVSYVESLLPSPIDHPIFSTCWHFMPSKELGGDCFGYHWINERLFAIYLLDVCGHGIGPALLSVSLINILRNQQLSQIDFIHPKEVLAALNRSFPMEEQRNLFFTLWYGVYDSATSLLRYATGGHPPALLLRQEGEKMSLRPLKTDGMIIGVFNDAVYEEAEELLLPSDRLFIFSDGVFELKTGEGEVATFEDFHRRLVQLPTERSIQEQLELLLVQSREVSRCTPFQDDFSIVALVVH